MYVYLYVVRDGAHGEFRLQHAASGSSACSSLDERPPAATQPSLKEIEGHASSPQPKWKVWKVDTPRGEIVRALRERKKARKRWGGIS